MPRKKPVKVRKWVTCAEPGCKRRAGTSKPYCGEHQKKFNKMAAAATAKRKKATAAGDAMRKKIAADKKKRAVKKPARGKTRKGMAAAAKRRIAAKSRHPEIKRKKVSGAPPSRLIKAHCEQCGYTIRLSRKWIEVKRPMCPVCMSNMVTAIDLELAGLKSLKLKGIV